MPYCKMFICFFIKSFEDCGYVEVFVIRDVIAPTHTHTHTHTAVFCVDIANKSIYIYSLATS